MTRPPKLAKRLETFLKTYATQDGQTLSYIEKVYADKPRADVKKADFPRIWIQDRSPSDRYGVGSEKQRYAVDITFWIYVGKDSIVVDSSGSTISSPEEAIYIISTALKDFLIDNQSTLAGTYEEGVLALNGFNYDFLGEDQTDFINLDVYKGFLQISDGIYIR